MCEQITTCAGAMFKLCPNESTRRLWCPTWINSYEGPMPLCEECAKTFQPEHNECTADGAWRWDDEADRAFASVHVINRYKDPERFANASGMVQNGAVAVYRVRGDSHASIRVVDGHYWLLTEYSVTDLGTDARQDWPELFSVRVVPVSANDTTRLTNVYGVHRSIR